MGDHELDVERRLTALEIQHDRTIGDLEKVSNQLANITSKLDKYEGKWGGVIMVMSAVAALMSIFWKSVHEVFFGR